jgi:hypothetical protein
LKTCAYAECGQEFQAKTHNQRYCSDDCCRKATNARLMQQYYEKKARLKGHIRVCASPDCGTVLSRYNNSKVCRKCEATEEQGKRLELLFNLAGI